MKAPSLQLLYDSLDYNPETGIFTRLKCIKKSLIGKEAGTLNQNGYVQVSLGSTLYYAHRLAWQYVYKEAPNVLMDHINGNRTDNRISNLRLANNRINSQNIIARGTHFSKKSKRWEAGICVNYKRIHLGYFNTEEEAHVAYKRAKQFHHPEARR